jgi:hypothetical protein
MQHDNSHRFVVMWAFEKSNNIVHSVSLDDIFAAASSVRSPHILTNTTKLRGFSPQANYTGRGTTACRRSWYGMLCSGAGFPMHCDLYVAYCTSPVNLLAVVIPSRRDGTARPTYQRTAEPPPGGGIEDYDGRVMSAILLRGPLGT